MKLTRFVSGSVQLCFVVMLLFGASQVSAGYFYSLHFDQDAYQVTAGSTLTVNLLLRELATEGDVSRIGFVDQANGGRVYGVAGAEFMVSWTGSQQLVEKSTDATAGSGFKRISGTIKPSYVTMRETQLDPVSGDGVVGYDVTGQTGLREVLLGTLKFTIPTDFTADATIVLGEEDNKPAGDFLVKNGPETGNVLIIDPWLQSGSARLTAVPEPSSIALMGLAMAIGGGCWWRKRQSVVAAR